MNFSQHELEQIESHGLTQEKIQAQLNMLESGTQYVQLERAATLDDGIMSFKEMDNLIKSFEEFKESGKVLKFIPASGAASRMFKSLLTALNHEELNHISDFENSEEAYARDVVSFFNNLSKFAFYEDLCATLEKNSFDSKTVINEGKIKLILEFLLTGKGLNYANLPKAFLKFHKDKNRSITPFQEHLLEGISTIKDTKNQVQLHYTLNQEFIDSDILKEQTETNPTESEVSFDLKYSIQKPQTDTIAADENGKPFITDDGQLLFRPGGHGALIHNLNDLNADIIIVKNIDNVSAQKKSKEIAVSYKKAIAGYLVELRNEIFATLKELDQGIIPDQISELLSKLNVPKEEIAKLVNDLPGLHAKLNRPVRVCGMVKNEGEPGGGPFWVNRDGEISLQIIESAQIDMNNKEQKDIALKATHFNPVDLTLSITNYKGEKFNLLDYVDNKMAFVAEKSFQGRTLKALEWPGLWNGAMADWLTIFVEVPLETFTPVKTVLDLLRPEHQEG